MAEPVEREGAVDVLEDAVQLLRQAPLGTWLCAWAASAPFALALLRFWNDATNPRTPDATCALESLALALLLVWMNCWRAVFAGRLRAQLGGSENLRWTRARLWNLAAGQAFLGATRLAAVPLAALIMFPLAATVGFYRNAAVLAGHEDLGPAELMAKARRLARIDGGQGWSLMAILTFIYVLAAINLAIAIGVLPQLARMLTGYESAFSRGGMYFVVNPLFPILVLAAAWMVFDPLAQAAWCVRCFRAESVETGEDVRAALRRLASVATALLLLVSIRPALAVTPADLERSVQRAAQSHEYDWRIPPPAGSAAKPSWLATFADHVVTGVRSLYHTVYGAIASVLKWLFHRNVPMPQPGAAPGAALHWSLYVLIAAVAAAGAWIAWRKWRSRRAKPGRAAADSTLAIRLDAADLTADRLPEEAWNELGERSLGEGNLRLALRAFYLGSLAWLGRREYLAIDPGKTNREYEVELRRRARAFPEARGLFAANVAAFERAWYGMHDVGGDDVTRFRRRVDGMKTALAPPAGAAA